ncbi:uncharacterized protein [Littorina saxatilis]|uniref:uncharacterized protein isoform X2 n=1 Tax=Littorina saxatilis TaxID=31220 RepID=UPI0038B605E1
MHCCLRHNMEHLATVLAACHLLVTLLTLPAAGTDRYSHTSPLVCMRGRDRSSHVDIDCHHTVTPSLISVTRVIHGLTPNTSGCDVTAPRVTCCPDPYDPARDCVFSSEEEVRAVKARCDGLVTCETSLDRATVADQCPDRGNGATYGRYSDFARVEFVCASSALLSDVCAANTTVTGDHVFLETNFLHDNRHHSNKTCSCVVTTACRNSLIFKVLDLDLSHDAEGGCRERVVVTEGEGGGVLASINCSYDPLLPGKAGTIFTSQSSVATFDLDVTNNTTGRVLVVVTATQGAPVEVVCGQPARQSLLTDLSQCSAPTTPPPAQQDVSSPLYNTTRAACLQGRDISHDFEITCLNKGAPGLISVERILHALTPDVMGCDVMAPRNSCCPGYDPARDCVFSSQEGLAELRKKCDGSKECYPSLRRATVSGACPPTQDGALTYGAYSHSAWVEYSCINMGLLGDVCDAGSTTQHTELYLESNVYHVNSEQRNTSCTCHVTAPCRQSLVFTVLQLALTSNKAGRCLETVVMEDGGNSSLTLTLDCSHNQLDEGERGEGGGVFVSQSNLVIFSLHLPANHTGKILFRVTASDGGMLEARCGRTTELDVWDQHRCTSVTPQPQPTSYTLTSVTSTLMSSTAPGRNVTRDLTAGDTTKGGNNDDNDSSLNTGVAIGVSVVAFLVVLLTIIVIVVIWRSKKRSPDDDEDRYIVRYVGPDPEPLAIVNPSLASHYDNVANTVRDPPHSQREKHVYDVVILPEEGEEVGAVGGVANPIYDYARHDITSDKEKW